MIPTDLISTKEAKLILGFQTIEAVRYYINTGKLRGFKNQRGYLFVSKAEVEDLKQPVFMRV